MLAVANEPDERLDQAVPGGEPLQLVAGHRGLAPEAAEQGHGLLGHLHAGQRLDLEVGAEGEGDLERVDVLVGVHVDADAAAHVGGHVLELLLRARESATSASASGVGDGAGPPAAARRGARRRGGRGRPARGARRSGGRGSGRTPRAGPGGPRRRARRARRGRPARLRQASAQGGELVRQRGQHRVEAADRLGEDANLVRVEVGEEGLLARLDDHVHLDRAGLAEPVEAADALLEHER